MITEQRHRSLVRARVDLGTFVRRRAAATAAEVGFTWLGTETAPSTYQQLRGAFQVAQSTGDALPISNKHDESTVYSSSSDNMAFRFWHDVQHVRLGLSFRPEDELELALWHLNEAEVAGFPRSSIVYELLSVDLLGQIMLMGLIGRFPLDQQAFVTSCIELGLAAGLLSEIRRMPSTP